MFHVKHFTCVKHKKVFVSEALMDYNINTKTSKADIRNPLSLLAHERSRFATCQCEILTPTDISIPLTHRLVLYALEVGNAYFTFKWN